MELWSIAQLKVLQKKTLIQNPSTLGWGVCEEGFEGEVEEVQKKGNDPFATLGSIQNPTILRN